MLLGGCARRASDRVRTAAAPESRAARRAAAHFPSVTGNESLSYRVQVDPALHRIDVELCPSGFRIERLETPSPGAARLLIGGKVFTARGPTDAVRGGAVDLGASKPGECVSYGVLLPERPADGLLRVGSDLLASPDWWLWVATPRPAGLRVRARFVLPEGVVVAVPWLKQATESAAEAFQIPETVFEWKAAGAFAHSALQPLAVPGSMLELAELGGGFGAGDAAVRAWFEQGATTASLLFGRFPVPRALAIAVPRERQARSFGMALRGGGPAVVIELDRRSNSASLAQDGTCTHEFLHLGIPRLPVEDSWFFEGLATYYSELTRARAGIISPERAFQNLFDGFERGKQDVLAPLSLREESAQMRSRHSFQRVYWAGAALALLTDLSARRAGGKTLDFALRSFAECCASSEQDWTAQRVLAELDGRLGAPHYEELARQWLDRKEFPATESALRALGVAPGRDGEASFSAAPNSAIRSAMTARAPAAPDDATLQ